MVVAGRVHVETTVYQVVDVCCASGLLACDQDRDVSKNLRAGSPWRLCPSCPRLLLVMCVRFADALKLRLACV